MTPKKSYLLDTPNNRKTSSPNQLHMRLDKRGLDKELYKWCKRKDIRHVIHHADQEGGYCSVCKKSKYIDIMITLDCNYEPTELLQKLEMDLGQEPREVRLPEGLRIGHIVVSPGTIILAPRGHRDGIESMNGEEMAEIPIRCGTVEEILYSLYYYYSPRLAGGSCDRRWMRGLLKVSDGLFTPNIC